MHRKKSKNFIVTFHGQKLKFFKTVAFHCELTLKVTVRIPLIYSCEVSNFDFQSGVKSLGIMIRDQIFTL